MRASSEFRRLAATVGKRYAAAILTGESRFKRNARQAGHDKAKAIRNAWDKAAPSASREYQRLRAHASGVAKQGRPLSWRLRDGFQVSQANRVKDSSEVSLWLHDGEGLWQLRHREQVPTEALDAKAQAKGYPPNFVHSHDAALLREIIRTGAERGIGRWGVAHDCVAVHANDGGLMRECAAAAVRWLYPDADAGVGWYTFS
jgi:DNA-directed RNA polymerase